MPGPDDMVRAQRLAREMDDCKYKFGTCSRRLCDCTGFQAVLINSLKGKSNVFVRLFGTGNIREKAGALGLRGGRGQPDDLNLGVRYPWESKSGIGHIGGTLGGLKVECRSGDGVVIGRDARGADSPMFLHHFHLPIDNLRLLEPFPGHGHRKGHGPERHVKLIQHRLNVIAGSQGHGALHGRHLPVNGKFDADTESVVKSFQRHRNLEDSGIVGPKTWVRMFRKRT